MAKIELPRYSDLRFDVHFTDVDLTGAVVDIAEQHPDLGASITVTNAAEGRARVFAEYSDAWAKARLMSFVIRYSFGTFNSAIDRIFVSIK